MSDGFPVINKLEVEGDIAHDAVDSGKPVKIGVKVVDYEPDTEDEQGRAEVAEGDRGDVAANLRQELIEGVNSLFHLFDGAFPDTGLDGVYDNSPIQSTSETVECWNYRYATFGFSIVSAGSPTSIQIFVQVSADGTNFVDLTNDALGGWIHSDASAQTLIFDSYMFPIAARFIRIKMAATGTGISDTFTIDDSFIYLRN